MKLSDKGYSLIVKHETGNNIKKYLKAYLDPVGKPTIGIGSTYYENKKPVKMGDEISEARAKQLFLNNIKEFEDAVKRLVKVPLLQNQFDALVSFSYNVGIGALSSSTLLKKINSKSPDYEISKEFLKWNKGTISGKKVILNGLTKRRIEESNLYLSTMTTSNKMVSFGLILALIATYFVLTK